MDRKFVSFGILCLASVASAGVTNIRSRSDTVESKPVDNKPKPNILKEYVCLRDGELCHPDFAKNRGVYVSCANGIAWEQNCPKCSYHPINCPTKSLWFDGEKCDWASPKLASQPCLDRFPYPISDLNDASVKEPSGLTEQDALFQSLQSTPNQLVQVPQVQVQNNPAVQPMPQSSSPASGYFKSPKSQEEEFETDVLEFKSQAPILDVDANSNELDVKSQNVRKSAEETPEFPSYISPDDSVGGSNIVRLNEPVYALVSSPDGSGKQVLMRVFKPFVLEDPGRSLFPNVNFINPYAVHKD